MIQISTADRRLVQALLKYILSLPVVPQAVLLVRWFSFLLPGIMIRKFIERKHQMFSKKQCNYFRHGTLLLLSFEHHNIHINTKTIKYLSSNTACFILCEATCFGPYMTIIRPICGSS